MKRLISIIVFVLILAGVAFGIYYNETKANYYLVTTNLEYGVLVVAEGAEALEDPSDLKTAGVKKDVYLKFNDSDKAMFYCGKVEIKKDDKGLIIPRYYAKIKPLSRLGIRMLLKN